MHRPGVEAPDDALDLAGPALDRLLALTPGQVLRLGGGLGGFGGRPSAARPRRARRLGLGSALVGCGGRRASGSDGSGGPVGRSLRATHGLGRGSQRRRARRGRRPPRRRRRVVHRRSARVPVTTGRSPKRRGASLTAAGRGTRFEVYGIALWRRLAQAASRGHREQRGDRFGRHLDGDPGAGDHRDRVTEELLGARQRRDHDRRQRPRARPVGRASAAARRRARR